MTDKTQDHDVNNYTLPSNPKDREKIKTMLDVVVGEMRMIDDRKTSIKETIAALHEEYAIPKKVLTKLARTMFKDDYQDVTYESEVFELFYEGVVEKNHNQPVATTNINDGEEGE